MPFGTYLANALITDYVVNGPAVYVQLHTANPTAAGTVAPVANLARINATGKFTGNGSGGASNNADLLSAEFPANVTVTNISIWDAPTGGGCLYYGGTTTSRAVTAGDVWRAAVGALTVTNQT